MHWSSVLKFYKVYRSKIYILKISYNVLDQHCPVEFIFCVSNKHTSNENIFNGKTYLAVYSKIEGKP